MNFHLLKFNCNSMNYSKYMTLWYILKLLQQRKILLKFSGNKDKSSHQDWRDLAVFSHESKIIYLISEKNLEGILNWK
jgi:hypothetical protein